MLSYSVLFIKKINYHASTIDVFLVNLGIFYRSGSSRRKCHVKMTLLKIPQYYRKTPVLQSFFNKVAESSYLQQGRFIKKRFKHRCFSVNIANFLRNVL